MPNNTAPKKRRRIRKIIVTVGVLLLLNSIAGALFYYFSLHPIPPSVKEDDRQRVVLVGDSITNGTLYIFRSTERSYPKELQKLLGGEYQVLNYGYSGRTAIKTGDYPYWEEAYLELSMAAKPGYVLIMLGTNDSKPQNWDSVAYKSDLIELVQMYKGLESQPRVYLLTPPTAFAQEGKQLAVYDIDPDIINKDIVDIIYVIGQELNVPVIDLQSFTIEHPEFFKDGVHLNQAGNEHVAGFLYEVIWPEKP